MSISNAHQLHHPEPAALDPPTTRWLQVQQAVAATIVVTFTALQSIVTRSVVPPIVIVMVLFSALLLDPWVSELRAHARVHPA